MEAGPRLYTEKLFRTDSFVAAGSLYALFLIQHVADIAVVGYEVGIEDLFNAEHEVEDSFAGDLAQVFHLAAVDADDGSGTLAKSLDVLVNALLKPIFFRVVAAIDNGSIIGIIYQDLNRTGRKFLILTSFQPVPLLASLS